ncbi:protein-L-isoaspartate D-aspartate O-methyltransferase [Gloeophyllum trabeum ATCC 11539]|uniref:Protein-L-isoaspartate O-methyltransferase n=1 Tax=Gloeophyllum trabeum (strain ATCC 11539 / FP-39264 / Madison 617) TaxID=670483 RepID=S7PXI6_GLOTA|nr:protein-L-isoaspartate D-aspartate O-methyltransferase [Gloeophyllum trabeum ATCC 11539]EPQ52326.1 protein-L-isoaspartate D-aspartate O-methyltransferase [Gloeophyllum trabeum ATCC 11539]
MAWRSSGSTNAELISNMLRNGVFNSERVAAAMTKVDRANYVLDKGDAYMDSPQRIGYGATISAPHMHAHAAETLLPFLRPGARVLDVGSGSGYLCAVLFHLVDAPGSQGQGKVVGIEHVPELVERSTENLRRDGLGRALDEARIEVVAGDGREGYAREGPYDAIHVGAAAPSMPKKLVEQLKAPGRMFIPVGTSEQKIVQVDKDETGAVTETELIDVMYVPLTDRPQ